MQGGLGLTEEELRSGRLMVVNYWRPITKVPLERNPLAVLDASSIGDSLTLTHTYLLTHSLCR